MTISVSAVYENGVLRPDQPVELPDQSRVHLLIERVENSRTPLGAQLRALHSAIIGTGTARLNWDEIAEEIAQLRGGYREDK